VLEPALIGTPILFGPQMFNFKEIAERILLEEAAVQSQDLEEIAAAVIKIYADVDYKNMLIAKAKAFVLRNQGATRRTADMLSQSL
jgi:3-deoxy-D-manno-octulosonic-acid transferase